MVLYYLVTHHQPRVGPLGAEAGSGLGGEGEGGRLLQPGVNMLPIVKKKDVFEQKKKLKTQFIRNV